MRILPNAQKLVNRLKFGVGATKINSDIRKLTFEYRSRDPAPTVRFLQKALPRLQFHNPGVTFEIIKHNPVKFKPIRERKPREEQNAAAEAEKPVTEAVEQTTAVAVEQPKAEVSEQVAKKVAESAASKPAKAPTPRGKEGSTHPYCGVCQRQIRHLEAEEHPQQEHRRETDQRHLFKPQPQSRASP
ncbi:hypothetical protein K493DRAFT_343268 [Basidiobolus meristosporus CBS 931.73]|uniref:Ribosomal protein/NADH dehydrogenase domain-containing protein n=1 Tax=Basidiobolus meristosporus CBS 931.73 TaxID=1314790 RepID=A0A1Y1VWW6_9FUNG|nr:hypothetical protein K493DRAFT_343268 [Basidiobolus meristosporus CBS 931.73]|eukprot:ORX65505.1 hypothetical protein K493DRAFT_343268 [Basidiobolus meristosporus CBS 931.73]